MTRLARVTIVDYGLGNMYSVARLFRTIGAEVTIASDPAEIRAAERLVLPGVGAFRDGMAGLQVRGLVEPIREVAASGRPLFGICLGMQLIMTEGTEFGRIKGLGLISGTVVTFGADGQPVHGKVPHVGWSRLAPQLPWSGSALGTTPPGSSVYFSHSFFPEPTDTSVILATATHAGIDFCSYIRKDNIEASQFHPDMSGRVGLGIAAAFTDRS